MDMVQLLRGVELFDGLSDSELARLSHLCREAHFRKGEVITQQGQPGNELYIVREGLVEVSVGAPASDGTHAPPQTVVNLGTGQVVGEMALVDHGPRSATVRCVTPTTLHVIEREAFEQLCLLNHHIGLVVYRNLAADLSFKLRHRNLARR
jgi:CRP-like cAMP-binding protein